MVKEVVVFFKEFYYNDKFVVGEEIVVVFIVFVFVVVDIYRL